MSTRPSGIRLAAPLVAALILASTARAQETRTDASCKLLAARALPGDLKRLRA